MSFPNDPRFGAGACARIIDFARSEVFERTYREGMALVEETAAYLDGPGRSAARTLPRMAALAYAGETMRLTTRLMQVASWLMVQRAVREGEISPEEARAEKYRLAENAGAGPEMFLAAVELPQPLRDLAARSDALYGRVERLDAGMSETLGEGEASPVEQQMARLRAAFGRD
jgi:regulator of CtrA degradation